MKITVWGINYAPEVTGIGPYNTALCRFLADRGHEVRMVTTFPYYPHWQKRREDCDAIYRTDAVENVTVHRCWHYVPRKATALRRIAHELSFVVSAFLRLLFLPVPELVVVVSPPLLLGAAAWIFRLLTGVPYIFHVQDLQPDAAGALGMVRSGTFMKCLHALERCAYQHAARVSGISPAMMTAFSDKGVPAGQQFYFPNPVLCPDDATLPALGQFRQRHNIPEDKFLVVYSGNLGRKQGLEILIEAARFIQDKRVQFVLCGEGTQRAHLEELSQVRAITNVLFLPLQEPAHYAELMVDADICVIPQQPGSGRCFLPSKLLAALAYAKPVLAVADAASDLVAFVEEGKCGVCLPAGDPQLLARNLDDLVAAPMRIKPMGSNGRRFVERFSVDEIFDRVECVLEQIVQPNEVKRPDPLALVRRAIKAVKNWQTSKPLH